MSGYFGGKKISKVYLGTTVIYKEEEEVVEPMFLLDTNLASNSTVYKLVKRKDGTNKKAESGDPFYEGDTFRAVLLDPTYKFDGAPTYRPKGSTDRIPFETRKTDQEYWTTFPQGYDGGAYFPRTKV